MQRKGASKVKTVVRVGLGKDGVPGAVGRDEVLDMLRYVGFLRSNVAGFPHFIEYESDLAPWMVMKTEGARWKSFGATVEAR